MVKGRDTSESRESMLTPKGIFAELVKLRNEVGGNLYIRLSLVQTLLDSHGWMPVLGVTSLASAITALEEECFGDICGAMGLPEMLEVLKEVPDEKEWRAAKYNLRKLHQQMLAKRPKKATIVEVREPALKASFTLGGFEELRKENKELRRQLKLLTMRNRKLQRALKRILANLFCPDALQGNTPLPD